jgi:ectoine hydroxylase-related dioxygenase (phytanoyl-CoA dioxygenase family)
MPALINDDDVAFFRANGYLKVPGVIGGEELARLQAETKAAVAHGSEAVRSEPGHFYAESADGQTKILSRVEFPSHWSMACRELMGHPDLLRMVETISGPDFISIGDGMVLKMPGEGAEVTWHRDHGSEWAGSPQNYNVDIYLDDAEPHNCVWAIPGSNLWSDEQASRYQGKSCVPADEPDAVPCEMKAGDVLLHDARVIHGSPLTTTDSLRRTLYFWFYSYAALAPYTASPGYVGKRWQFLQQCIAARQQSSVSDGETPFVYRAAVPDDLSEGDVSYIYWDHGNWHP